MTDLTAVLDKLSPKHRKAINWFIKHQDEIVPWPKPLPDGTFLVNRPKGIHKPAGWRYALSVRQTLDGPYADEEPVRLPDGSWTYRYYQEQADPSQRDQQFTNRALLEAHKDGIPIGVLRQFQKEPSVLYRVLGIALVDGWQDGYFMLRGLSSAAAQQRQNA
jgi:putative restriction endonuclease